MILLRPHHALCLQTFVGKGYSSGFSENMTRIHQDLNRCPGQPVSFVFGADEICRACPNLKDGVCLKEESCSELDRQVAEKLALKSGDVLSWGTVAALVKKRLLNTGAYQRICRGCSWEELCTAQREGLTNAAE